MMSNHTKAALAAIISLAAIYFLLLPLGSNGYGYAGYYGYHRGPSFLYSGSATTYHERGVRDGSIGGPDFRGGGPGSGK